MPHICLVFVYTRPLVSLRNGRSCCCRPTPTLLLSVNQLAQTERSQFAPSVTMSVFYTSFENQCVLSNTGKSQSDYIQSH